MKLTFAREALIKSLARVQGIVEKRTTIPVLSNVKIDADGNGVSLTATDMDISAVDTAEAEITGQGSVTVPAQTLYGIARKLPATLDVVMAINEAGNEINISAGRSSFDLPCLPPDDFPEISDTDTDCSFSIPVGDLIKLLDKSRFAVSTEETRYYLNGIFLHVNEFGPNGEDQKTLRSVATDGHRLARVETDLPDGASSMPGVILPTKTVTELRKLIDDLDADDTVVVALSTFRIRFGVGKTVLRSRLIDGTYPDYMRVIPTDNDKTLSIPVTDLIESADRVATVATDKSRALKFLLEQGKLTLESHNQDAGHAIEEIDVDYQGDTVETGFNAKYLLDVASQIDGDTVEMSFGSPGGPALVRDPDDDKALFVLMPMRV